MVLTLLASPYGPALGSKVKKIQLQLQLQEKIENVAMRTAITWRYMENVTSFFSENKNSKYNEKIQEILLIKF
jgi:hypothetical protein